MSFTLADAIAENLTIYVNCGQSNCHHCDFSWNEDPV